MSGKAESGVDRPARWVRARGRWLLCLALLGTWGCGTTKPPAEALERGMLRHFSRNDGSGAYLLGSIHFAGSGLYPLPAAIDAAFRRSSLLVLEVDMGVVRSPEFALQMMRAGMYGDEDSLAAHLAPATLRLLEERSAEIGFPPDYFLRFRPWYCANALMLSALKKAGYDGAFGLDVHFYRQAEAMGKPIAALETPEYQLQLFASLSGKDEEDFLRQALDELDDIDTFAAELSRLWRAGDIDGLGRLIDKSFAGSDALREKLIDRRNRAWVRRLDELAQVAGGDLFAVVGAGHLPGNNGLLRLLKEAGWQEDLQSARSSSDEP